MPPRALPLLYPVKSKSTDKLSVLFSGAGDEARTRYLHLGKVALYRMSYARIGANKSYFTMLFAFVKLFFARFCGF